MKARQVLLSAAAMVIGLSAGVGAQQSGDPNHEWCRRQNDRDDRNERYCEVREFTLSAPSGGLTVDGGPNGSIEVEGWDGSGVLVQARVQAWSRDGDPEDMVRQITVNAGNRISSDIPRARNRRNRREGSAVSYRISVPRSMDLDLETLNGGITIGDVTGDIEFSATNGGIHLSGVGGDVRGRTTNGGVHVELFGDRWEGRGLDVATVNGGVTLVVPEGFRAELTTGTVNGGFDIDFPVTVQGRVNRRRITTELNGGGPPIRAVTTNGGVRVRRG